MRRHLEHESAEVLNDPLAGLALLLAVVPDGVVQE